MDYNVGRRQDELICSGNFGSGQIREVFVFRPSIPYFQLHIVTFIIMAQILIDPSRHQAITHCYTHVAINLYVARLRDYDLLVRFFGG